MAPGAARRRDREAWHGPQDVGGEVPVVLASASPRRAEILAMLGIRFAIAPAGVEERRSPGERPRRYVERLAREKASAVSPAHRGSLVIAGDTIVVLGAQVLEKPAGPDRAREMLAALSGRTHAVCSGLALAFKGRTASGVAVARVVFRDLSGDEIARYVETGEPLDKAGAYGIQGCGAALVREVKGDYFTVVGFSVAAFMDLLPELGLEYRPGTGVVAVGGAGAADPAGSTGRRREACGPAGRPTRRVKT